MVNFFQSIHKHASSSYCETYFGERKHRLASKYGCPIRADKFVRIEINDHEGSAKLFASKLIESLDQTKTNTSQTEVFLEWDNHE